MFSGANSDAKKQTRPEKTSLDADYLKVYTKAWQKHQDFILRIETSLKAPDMQKTGMCTAFTALVLEQHKVRLAILAKMINNQTISADEHQLLLAWPGTRGKPEFMNYPQAQKPSTQRRHST